MAAARKRTPSPRVAFRRDWVKRSSTLRRLGLQPARGLSVDDVHDLRVTTRRLRASLSVLRHCAAPDARQRRARHELRAMGRALGERRMLDVALRDAGEFRADTAHIEKRLAKANTALHRALRADRVRALGSDLREMERVITAAPFERVSPWLEGFEWELAYLLQVPPRTGEARHELRVQLKKVRYIIEAFGRRSASLQKLQDHLGREHDLAVLQSLSGRIPAAARDERAARRRAERLMGTALRSAMKHMRAIRRELSG
jgi:CHAD domain-containing protein